MTLETSHYIGAGVGGGTCLILTTLSFFSKKTRCSMVLMIPSILTKRGRSFVLTFITGLLVDGPIETIEHNLQEVIRSFTCMYEQMKWLKEKYTLQFNSIFKQIGELLGSVQDMVNEYRVQMEKLAENATRETRDKINASKKKVEEQARKVKEALDKISPVLNAPGNILNKVCDTGKKVASALAGAATDFVDGVKDLGNKIKDFFGRRRKRGSGCGPKLTLPQVNIGVDNISLDAFKSLIEKLKPGAIDLFDFNLDDIIGELDNSSLENIRAKLKTILKGALDFGKLVAQWSSKVFYFSIVLIIIDAIQYMRKYYSDDAFDNMFIDSNIRWREENYVELTPMRNWELNDRYQISTSIKLAGEEVKRMLIEMIPTMIFTVIVIGIVLTDYSFYYVLVTFQENAKFGISFEGMEKGITLRSLVDDLHSNKIINIAIQPFNLTSDPCLPVAMKTDAGRLGVIFGLLTFCMLTCFLDAYISRWRSRICNTFFPMRATERGRFLYKKIQAGRRSRHHQLQMILNRAFSTRKRTREFYGVLHYATDLIMFQVIIIIICWIKIQPFSNVLKHFISRTRQITLFLFNYSTFIYYLLYFRGVGHQDALDVTGNC